MFIGREKELARINELFSKSTSSLVVCRGRRRIGKSTLIQKFGSKHTFFLEFQGLAPHDGITRQDQLNEFIDQISLQTMVPKVEVNSWPQAFSLLASQISKTEKTVVLLDEISWMAQKDKNFAGHLKIAWDTLFKKFPHLVLVLCGSVSSWIEKNILNNTGFVGRISLELSLEQLPLYYCNLFWKEKKERISTLEKLKVLSITGGIPRYLEEINPNKSAEYNIKRICFSPGGFLVNEFEQIFSDIFNKRSTIYKEILNALIKGSKSLSEIAHSINRERNGDLSAYLSDLEKSGFIKKELVFNIKSTNHGKLHKYHIIDNYIRFFLKYIEPVKQNILKGLYEEIALDKIVQWDTIIGLQFETLILNNLNTICRLLDIEFDTILNASPYFQRNTLRQEACQVDLLIQTKYTIYICEIKCRRTIGKKVIHEVMDKVRKIKIPQGISLRTVLIYEGKLSKEVTNERYFDNLISFSGILNIID